LSSNIIQQFGSIYLSSSGAYCDIVIQGGDSVISASSYGDRFITVEGSHTLQFHDITFQNFGSYYLNGGVMYYSDVSSVLINNVIFNSNIGSNGGAIYL
jgi:hypothetical protein